MRSHDYGSNVRICSCVTVVVLAICCFSGAFAEDAATLSSQNPPVSATESAATLPAEMRGDLMMYRQRYVAAIDAYRQAPQDSPIIWNKIGIAYHHLFALSEAKMDYQKALVLNPRYSEALNNLGTIYYAEKNYRKAKSFYKKALKIAPQSAVIYNNLATVYFSESKFKEGTEALNRAYSIDPQVFDGNAAAKISEPGHIRERAKLDYCLAKVFAMAGNKDRALAALRIALDEGFDDRKKLKADPEWALLRDTPEFKVLLGDQRLQHD